MSLTFLYHGIPRGQERPRFGNRAYKSAEAKAYEQAIAVAYRQAARNAKPLEGPVGISVAAGYPIPDSDSKTKKRDKAAGMILPVKKPDLDNVAKAVLDALNGLAWLDDRQVVYLYTYKVYAENPGLIVTIYSGNDLEDLRKEKRE